MTDKQDSPISYYEQPVCDVVESVGVDYFTCTQDRGDEAAELWELANEVLEHTTQEGNDLKQHGWKGYECRTSGQVTIGHRGESILCRMSGAAADRYWPTFLPLARNVSRLDFQVTGKYATPRPGLARHSFGRIPERPFDRGRPRGIGIVAHRSWGDTLLLGSRASDAYARHYDKGMESGQEPAGKVWRWEIEWKRAQARALAVSLVGTEDPSTYIQDQVYSWLWRWGLKPGFPRRRHLYTG